MTEMLQLAYSTTIDGNAVKWGRIGSGPALVAIHGTPFSSQVWRKIIPHVADRRTVFYFDLVGYGQSEMREDQDVSLAVQNKVLCALFKEWGLERPDILAHDFGGATALRAYFLDGLRYSSLTIFDTVALAPWGSPFVQHVKLHQAAFAGMPGYMHRALLRLIFRHPRIIHSRKKPCLSTRNHGSAWLGRLLSIGKLRKWISSIRTR